MDEPRLTKRGERLLIAVVLTGFILIMGFVTWYETYGM